MAYYSNSGAQIHSGAAGVGSYATALQKQQSDAFRRSQKLSEERRNRVVRKTPVRGFGAGMGFSTNWGPSPRAYQDGSLGNYGPLMAFHDGSLGDSGPGPLRSFKDGSLGMPLFLETKEGIEQLETPVTIHHGPMGEYFTPSATGEYFSGTSGCRGCGVGQTASAPTIDLSNPATMKEVKLAMVMSPWMGTAPQTPEAMADVEDPVWTKMTVQIVGAWVSGYVETLYAQPNPPATPKATFMDAVLADGFEGEFFVPNAAGIRHIYFGATAGAIAVGQNPAEAFPILTKFLTEETASGAEGGVLPPAIEGQVPAKGGNMLAIGLGLAALAVVGVAVMGKKKR